MYTQASYMYINIILCYSCFSSDLQHDSSVPEPRSHYFALIIGVNLALIVVGVIVGV